MNHRRQPHRPRAIPTLSLLLAGFAALAAAGCGGGEGDAGAGNPESRAVDYERALAGAPGPLADLYAQGNELLGGGAEAFQERLERLRGYPVVVNKWASWCGPCRFEFPFFQELAAKHGEEVAFLGVDTDDSEDAARTFLEELPLPYPSYSDPDGEIADLLDAREFPATVFYDERGEIVYTRRGGYGSLEELAADIQRYAG